MGNLRYVNRRPTTNRFMEDLSWLVVSFCSLHLLSVSVILIIEARFRRVPWYTRYEEDTFVRDTRAAMDEIS